MEKIDQAVEALKENLRDLKASFYLRKNAAKVHSADKPMKVGFIVFEPETWDKLDPVYRELKERPGVITEIVIVPSFDQELKLTTKYGPELQFFQKIDPDARKACDADGKFLHIAELEYDYVFYQDPYNEHMPQGLRSNTAVKYSKVCYIPYGFSGADVFNPGNTNRSFFRNVYYGFMDVSSVSDVLNQRYRRNVRQGVQHFELLGYPAFSRFADMPKRAGIKKILWTPRWLYDEKKGGSHFIEYKDSYVSLRKKYPDLEMSIRPHPMMFSNFVREGRMTEQERNSYLEHLEKENIHLSHGEDLSKDFAEADLLITDYSSIIPMFHLMGKPIIYCQSGIQLNKEYTEIAESMYLADSWNDVEQYLQELLSGKDALRQKREQSIANLMRTHNGATERIADALCADFQKQRTVNR